MGADHRMHLAKEAQAAEVVAKLLLKSANAQGQYPLRDSMLSGDAAAVTAIFEQLQMAKAHLTQDQQVELINARVDSKKDEIFSSLAGAAMIKDADTLDGAIFPLLEGLKAMQCAEDTVVKVFNADNFGGNYSPMMIAAMMENPGAIVELSAVLEHLKADDLISDADLVHIFSKRDSSGNTLADNAMIGGNTKVIDAVFEGLKRVDMSNLDTERVLGFCVSGNEALGNVMNPLAKNIINNKDPQAIEAYANGLEKLKDAGVVTYEMTAVQFNKATMRAMLAGNADAVNKLGEVMRRILTPEHVFIQLNGKDASGQTTLQHCLEDGRISEAQALCDQLVKTDPTKAQDVFQSIPKFSLKSEAATAVLGDAIHAAHEAKY